MLSAKFLPVCALLSIAYERQFNAGGSWRGNYTTFGGSGVSHLILGCVPQHPRFFQATFLFEAAPYSFAVV
jgi:hypothetical protein